jgi:toxin ParE1/3/4
VEIRFTKLALTDLIEISVYTEEHWGAAQAERYVADLQALCQSLGNMPHLGKPFRCSTANARKLVTGTHAIFYALSDLGNLISRISHTSRSFPNHLLFAPPALAEPNDTP